MYRYSDVRSPSYAKRHLNLVYKIALNHKGRYRAFPETKKALIYKDHDKYEDVTYTHFI